MKNNYAKIFNYIWWLNLIVSIGLIIVQRYFTSSFTSKNKTLLIYMLVILFIFACKDSMKLHKISSQMNFVLILIISIIFCTAVIIYYLSLPRNRFSENIFIYLFFILIKIGAAHDIPKFLELPKGYNSKPNI